MFFLAMPVTFKIGDTADCKINGEPRRVTWRDAKTLVIEPDDARTIIDRHTDGELIEFTCTDADGSGDFTVVRD